MNNNLTFTFILFSLSRNSPDRKPHRINNASINRRRRPKEDDLEFIRYASCFIAMQMGTRLLRDMNKTIEQLTHHNFQNAYELIKQNWEASVEDIRKALNNLYTTPDISLQQLSATFRRGDLIETLQQVDLTEG